MNLSECRKQVWAGCEANIHKASFTERRLFYLNHHRHCEEGTLPGTARQGRCPDEAIALTVWEIALSKDKYALAMTMYKGMQ